MISNPNQRNRDQEVLKKEVSFKPDYSLYKFMVSFTCSAGIIKNRNTIFFDCQISRTYFYVSVNSVAQEKIDFVIQKSIQFSNVTAVENFILFSIKILLSSFFFNSYGS
jgi:hypothetical protein